MNKDVRDVLKQIDTVLAKGRRGGTYERLHASSHQLWNILTALRGPDSNRDDDKYASTCVIRAAALPKTFAKGKKNIPFGALMNYDSDIKADHRNAILDGHFKDHAKKAFATLDLRWYLTNVDETVDTATLPKRKKSK